MSEDKNEPIHLVENEDTGDRFLVYGIEGGQKLEIQFEGETLWMTQAQIGQLFGRDQSVVSRHINRILEDGELDESSTMQKVHIATSTKPVTIYNLDMVISVGYRVSSSQATMFRKWATGVLVQYAKKGFVIDSPRLKESGNISRIRELKEIIRDIRADEANVYAELRNICAMCQDYDGSTDTARSFYQQTQAKLIYAVVSHTPSELVQSRADHSADNMGLTSWPNENIRKADVGVAKNYLTETEMKELNRLTTILLDIFEDQAEMGLLVTMSDAKQMLESQLKNLKRAVLSGGGRVQSSAAKAHAERHYEQFKARLKIERKQMADQSIADLTKEGKALRGR